MRATPLSPLRQSRSGCRSPPNAATRSPPATWPLSVQGRATSGRPIGRSSAVPLTARVAVAFTWRGSHGSLCSRVKAALSHAGIKQGRTAASPRGSERPVRAEPDARFWGAAARRQGPSRSAAFTNQQPHRVGVIARQRLPLSAGMRPPAGPRAAARPPSPTTRRPAHPLVAVTTGRLRRPPRAPPAARRPPNPLGGGSACGRAAVHVRPCLPRVKRMSPTKAAEARANADAGPARSGGLGVR